MNEELDPALSGAAPVVLAAEAVPVVVAPAEANIVGEVAPVAAEIPTPDHLARGTRVSWAGGYTGVVFADLGDGHVLVAVDAGPNEEHRVIYCAVTWLTVIA